MAAVERPVVAFELVGVLAEDPAGLGVLRQHGRQPVPLDRADLGADRATAHLGNHGQAAGRIDPCLLDPTMEVPGRGQRPRRAPPDADLAGVADLRDPEVDRLVENERRIGIDDGDPAAGPGSRGQARRGLGKPETFNFLGLRHICGRSRRGKFQLWRHTRADRMRAKLKELKVELMRRRHQPLPAQGRWLGQVVGGFFGYHAVPTNSAALSAFLHHVKNLWRRALRRRSQKDRLTCARMGPAGCRLPVQTADPTPMAEHPFCRHTPEVGAV